jgi:hypothetical protein
MSADKHGNPVRGKLAAKIEAAIQEYKVDFVMIDPFVKSHAVEENNNSAIDDVIQILSDLATKYDIAIDVPHHISKGTPEPGNANRGRGASALKDAARLVMTATTMSPEEAEAFKIPEQDRRLYVRIDHGKVNIARPAAMAQWFKLTGVKLRNDNETYPNGDEVQTAEPWEPPETWADFAVDTINTVLSAIDGGIDGGKNFYTDASKAAGREAWVVVQRHAPNKSEKQCREIIRTWVNNGVLEGFEYENPDTRKPVRGLKLNASKRPGATP